MFIDVVKIEINSGKGGDGLVAFRREKYVDKGGPAGGSGGRGGDVIFVGEEGLSTLLDLRYNRVLKAPNGENGRAKSMHGKNATNLYVKVPVGTTIYDANTDKIIGDITENKQEVIAAFGGRGGRGNKEFASSKNTAPELSENGEPGKTREVRLELKVLADVGLVGFPSVGKSTLIAAVSKAKPKIAAYHFTTLTPNLGLVMVPDGRSFVMADLPGLIEGASQGAGLGHQFLRHIERCRVILHVIDMSGMEGRDPVDDYNKINLELGNYKYRLLERPTIIVANKMDVEGAKDNLERFKTEIKDEVDIVEVSALTKDNLNQLLYKAMDILEVTDEFLLYEDDNIEDIVEYSFTPEEASFRIVEAEDGVFEVKGEQVEKMLKMTDFTHDQSVKRFARQLKSIGVDEELRKLGVVDGDIVRILDFDFEFMD